MKNAFRLLALVLVICLTCSLMSCDVLDKVLGNDDDGNENNANPNVVALAGDYILDGTDYGMAMQWFIKINADETFKISTKNDYSVDKGNGTVKESAGTYMFLYSDSTVENPKTATFTVDNGNLVFSTGIPVGTVNFRNQNEDSDGTVVVYPAANVPSVVGSFAGELDKASRMGGSIHYDFTMDIKANGTYKFTSSFAMMSGTYAYVEEGTVKTAGTVITLKALKKVTAANIETGELTAIAEADQKEVTGSIENGVISIDMIPSPMISDAIAITLLVVPSYAGTYVGTLEKTTGMGTVNYNVSLEIKYNGTYKYTSNFTMMSGSYVYAEEGTCTVANGYAVTLKALKKVTAANMESGTLTDIAAENQTEVNGTIAMGGKLSISMMTSPMASAADALTLEQQ